MDETFLYQQIAESIRNQILDGRLKPGDRLPSVRQLNEQWNCTPGTVQRAYQELAHQGLVVSRAGKGTQVAGAIIPAQAQTQAPLRRAMLVNRTEAFLLEVLTAGHTLSEVQQALDLAMDHWRSLERTPETAPAQTLRFVGSHDLAINWIASHFDEIAEDATLQVSFTGSLGGLMTLAEGQADLAGCHLWDQEDDQYNAPFVRRLLPGRRVALVMLAYRRLGLILPPGNPLAIRGLPDLTRPGIRFVNRQAGSGTRVWLDAHLAQAKIRPQQIEGYANEKMTHSEVARLIAEGKAEAGLGLEEAAAVFGLDFVFLTRERYDLVIPAETLERPAVKALVSWLATPEAKTTLSYLTGYDLSQTGRLQWVK